MFEDISLLDNTHIYGPLPDLHLDSPLNNYLHAAITQTDYIPDTTIIKKELDEWDRVKEVFTLRLSMEPHITSHLHSWLLNLPSCFGQDSARRRLYKWLRQGEKTSGYSLLKDLDIPVEVVKYYTYDEIIRGLVLDSACFSTNRRCKRQLKSIPGTFQNALRCDLPGLNILCLRKIIIFDFATGIYIGTRSHLLLIASIIGDRYRSFLLSWVSKASPTDRRLPSLELLVSTYRWGDRILRKLGKEGFKVIKNFEPLMLGGLLKQANHVELKPSSFLDSIISQLNQYELSLPGLVQDTKKLLSDVAEEAVEDVAVWTELFGLYRQWGHPEVKGLDGLNAIKKIGQIWTFPDMDLVHRSFCCFKEEFFLNYLSKEGHYPPHSHTIKTSESEVRRALEEDDQVDPQAPSYNILDWLEVKCKQTFSVPIGTNLLASLGDKSHGAPQSEVVRYARQGRMPPAWNRKVLLSWLSQSQQSVQDLLHYVASGNWEPDDMAMGIMPKERELKPDPRNFGLLPYRMRQWVVITESLLNTYVLPLYPYTSLHDSAIELDQRIRSMTHGHSQRESTFKITINVDFEKWNNHMRKNLTQPWFQMLDDLFGIQGLYTRTHDFFSRAKIYLADNSVQLQGENGQLLPGPGVITGHLGGIEGLRQKGWTIVTSSIIRYICRQHNLSCDILGQGDNQVIMVEFPLLSSSVDEIERSREISEVMKRFWELRDQLKTGFDSVHLPLKLEETWFSDCVFAYGKRTYVNGVEAPMTLKKFAKVNPMVNQEFFSINNGLTSISGACSASLSNRFWPAPIMVLTKAEEARWITECLEWHPVLGESVINLISRKPYHTYQDGSTHLTGNIGSTVMNLIQSQRLTTVVDHLLIFPLGLGGLPIASEEALLIRAFPDHVSRDCEFVSRIGTSEGFILELIKNMLDPVMLQNPDPELLIEDPYSIPVVGAPNQANLLKRYVLQYLRASPKVQNPQFNELLRLRDADLVPLVQWLWSLSPCNPRLYGDILAATVPGCVETLLSKFEKTSTLIQLAYHMHGDIIPQTLRKMEIRMLTGCLYQLSARAGNPINGCPGMHSRTLRAIGWRRDDILGVSTPFPSSHLNAFLASGPTCSGCSEYDGTSGFILCRRLTRLFNESTHLQRGPGIAYLGSGTDEKIPYSQLTKSSVVDPMIRRVMTLARCVGWFIPPDSSIASLIKTIVGTVTNTPLEYLSNIGITVSGSMEHRYSDIYSPHGGFSNYLVNPCTYTHLSTTSMTKYSKGKGNYNIHFQAVMCWFQHVCTSMFLQYPNVDSIHIHECCNTCTIPLDEAHLYPTTALTLPSLTQCSKNESLWVEFSDISDYLSQTVPSTELSSFSDIDIAHCLSDHIYRSVHITPPVPENFRFSIPWIGRVDIGLTLINITINIGLSMIIHWSYYSRSGRVSVSYSDFLVGLRYKILFMKPERLGSLRPLFSTKEGRSMLKQAFPGCQFPNCAPYTTRSCDLYYHRVLLSILDDIFDPPNEYLFHLVRTVRLILTPGQRISPKQALDWIIARRVLLKLIVQAQSGRPDFQHNMFPVCGRLRRMIAEMAISSRSDVTIILNQINLFKDPIMHTNCTLDNLIKSNDVTEADQSSPSELQLIDLPRPTGCKVLLTCGEQCLTCTEPDQVPDNPLPHHHAPICHWYKPINDLTSACYKWLGLLSWASQNGMINISTEDCVLSLADGSGGIANLCARIFPRAKIGYTSLLWEPGTIEHSLAEFFPPAVSQNWDEDDFPLIKSMICARCDLGDPEFVNEFKYAYENAYESTECHIHLILCDAELPGGLKWKLTKRIIQTLIRLAMLPRQPPLIIQKVFASSNPFLQHILSLWIQAGFEVTVMSSCFTSTGSTELFLFASFTNPTTTRNRYISLELADSITRQCKTQLNVSWKDAAKLSRNFSRLIMTRRSFESVKHFCTLQYLKLGVVLPPFWSVRTLRFRIHTSISRSLRIPYIPHRHIGSSLAQRCLGKRQAFDIWAILTILRPRGRIDWIGRHLLSRPAKGILIIYTARSGIPVIWTANPIIAWDLLKNEESILLYDIPVNRDRTGILKSAYLFGGRLDLLNKWEPEYIPSTEMTIDDLARLWPSRKEDIIPLNQELHQKLNSTPILYA